MFSSATAASRVLSAIGKSTSEFTGEDQAQCQAVVPAGEVGVRAPASAADAVAA